MNRSTRALLFLAVALGCEAFAYWGLATASGRSAFDEMAGMVPLASGAAGLLFVAVAMWTWWRARRSRNDS